MEKAGESLKEDAGSAKTYGEDAAKEKAEDAASSAKKYGDE